MVVDSESETKEKGYLSTKTGYHQINRKKAKDKDKTFIQNQRPISLLNVDLKIKLKALSEKLKQVLPDLISSQQTAYVINRLISERGKLISGIIEIAKIKEVRSFSS